MKRKISLIIIAILALMILIMVMLPSIQSIFSKLVYKEWIEQVEVEALPANIQIIRSVERKVDNVTSTSFSGGFSGVIIGHEGDTYYALTAKHSILENLNSEVTQFIIIGYNEQNISELRQSGDEYPGMVEYYEQFPRAEILYSNEQYDLALICFTTDKKYMVLPIAGESPKADELVIAMSNPYGERNAITVGKIKRGDRIQFNDDQGERQYPMIVHTALCSVGSSGGALLNRNLEIVGIELGGNENIFRRFVSGMMMPSDRILEFLDRTGYEIRTNE